MKQKKKQNHIVSCQNTTNCSQKKQKNKKEYLFELSYLIEDVMDVVMQIVLPVNGICAHLSVNIIFEEEVLESHQIFLLKLNHHLVAQAKRHQLVRAMIV